MDIARVELKRTPPREPLTSLEALVRDFKWRFPRERRDTVWTVCLRSGTLPTAIRAATDSIKADGKMHNHQVKVRKSARDELAAILIARRREVKRTENFHELWTLVQDSRPWGIGPLTVYDVATRIGAYLGLHPQNLYLHTGARAGLRALCEAAGLDAGLLAEEWLPPNVLPRPIRTMLTMDETEDFLCTYRTMFATACVPRERT